MNSQCRPSAAPALSRAALSLAVAAGVMASIAPTPARAQSRDVQPLEVTPEKGTAPLGVMLTGPSSFVAQAHDFMFANGGCSAEQGRSRQVFTIDWGDDAQKTAVWPRAANPECRLTHDYTAAGTYKIRVGFFLPGAGDAMEPEWLGEATITVTAP